VSIATGISLSLVCLDFLTEFHTLVILFWKSFLLDSFRLFLLPHCHLKLSLWFRSYFFWSKTVFFPTTHIFLLGYPFLSYSFR
jgi:hypothetical protein